MSISVLYMSMSLDGYMAGPNDDPGNLGGDGFGRLHEWIVAPDGEFGRPSGPAAQLWDEWNAAGAVLAGRRTVEQVDHWNGDHHGVPIFVPSHRPPAPSVANYPLVTYVTDGIADAMAQAKAAAGDRNVMVHGAYTAQRALEVGVLGELQIHHVPVLFGGGRRLFELLSSRVELEIVRGDRYAGGHAHPVPRLSLSGATSGHVRQRDLLRLSRWGAGSSPAARQVRRLSDHRARVGHWHGANRNLEPGLGSPRPCS